MVSLHSLRLLSKLQTPEREDANFKVESVLDGEL